MKENKKWIANPFVWIVTALAVTITAIVFAFKTDKE